MLPGTLWVAWVLSTWRHTASLDSSLTGAEGGLAAGSTSGRRYEGSEALQNGQGSSSGGGAERRRWRGPRNRLGWPRPFTALQVCAVSAMRLGLLTSRCDAAVVCTFYQCMRQHCFQAPTWIPSEE